MRILSEEHKKKIGDSLRGRKRIFSEEAKRNIREAAAKRKGIKKGPCSEELKKKISDATKGVKKTITKPNSSWFEKGHKPAAGFNKGRIPWNKGGWPQEYKDRIDFGSGNRNTKNSKEIIEKRRQSLVKAWSKKEKSSERGGRLYKEWQRKVFERDENKCARCDKTEKLHAHHIISWKESVELRFELNNGLTLCHSCHMSVEGKLRPPLMEGKVFTEKHRKAMSDARKGKPSWNTDKYTEPPKIRVCIQCDVEKNIKEFTPQKTNGKIWYKHRCKGCRNLNLKKKRINDTE